MANDTGQSCVAQASVVENGVGDRWHYLHARVRHGITRICLCRTVASVRQIKRSFLNVYVPDTVLFIFSHLTLPFSIQVNRPHICLILFDSDSILSQTAIPLPFNSVISQFLFISPFILLCALTTVLQAKSNWQTEQRTHSHSDFACYCCLSVLPHENKM